MGKDVRIAVRVTAMEKEKIQAKARKCGLSVTEYVKQRALGYEPRTVPLDALFACLEKLGELADKASSPEQAFAIGKETARRMWGDRYQVLVTVHLKDNDEMNTLIESIQTQGILSPLIVQPIADTDEYEVISGHRRLHAAQKTGITEGVCL